jgi:hypothetical protein
MQQKNNRREELSLSGNDRDDEESFETKKGFEGWRIGGKGFNRRKAAVAAFVVDREEALAAAPVGRTRYSASAKTVEKVDLRVNARVAGAYLVVRA